MLRVRLVPLVLTESSDLSAATEYNKLHTVYYYIHLVTQRLLKL